jgi:hypothetical protein
MVQAIPWRHPRNPLFRQRTDKKGEVLHGDNSYIAEPLEGVDRREGRKEQKNRARLGVVGEPSDWLISSDVDYQKALDIFNIRSGRRQRRRRSSILIKQASRKSARGRTFKRSLIPPSSKGLRHL